jgi:hypothetical protein
MPCGTCHQNRNGELPGSPPGAEHWRLAPAGMGWGGLPAGKLCMRLKQIGAQAGGGDAVAHAIAHIVTPEGLDPLVAWAWEPGEGRAPPPGTVGQFIEILEWWKGAGAACP